MTASQAEEKNIASKWQLLLVYNLYRVGCVLLFWGIFLYQVTGMEEIDYTLLGLNSIYLFLACIFLYLKYIETPRFETQVILSGTIDVIVQSLLISLLSYPRFWIGILLNATIAALSILVPGRLAIFFASTASCMLLGFSIFQYGYNDSDNLNNFFYSGVYGAGIFATAITAWYLANRVRTSETIAAHRSYELANMQRINEYIVERLHSGIVYLDANNNIKLINDATRKFFNYPEQTELNSLVQLSSELDKKYNYYLDKVGDDLRPAKTMIEDPHLLVHFFPTVVENRITVLVLLEDMTAVSQQAQQLKLAALGRFSASIAHELRNPLGAIAHAAQLLGGNNPLHSDDARLQQLILNNCNRMNSIIKNVMQLSRREQSQQQSIELSAFLEQFKHDFCAYNPCHIEIELPESSMLSFYFDKSQLEQILVILCDNAIQHGRDGQDQVLISIKVRQLEHTMQLMVCDRGPGVADSMKDTIFEPFFSTVRTGYGMGLFIARDLCEINQARLTVSNMETGCCFTITLNETREMLL
ncbi:sensor histidine kinase [Legionella spiritensis]|uniref:sensor histidine kinase n=1 Tax=Legionella spiritensis TaxID=452 RepID=UPI000F6EE0F8|nr:HAMP domain-containing sensor histidine kinase [Legionella spiritensis]VEG90484.1 two-component system sensor kinase PilS [Legionella spiritensis]